MTLFIAAFVVFGVVLAAMAIGALVGNRHLAGSCGGLANLRTPDGEAMCECGARSGQACASDPDRRFAPGRGPRPRPHRRPMAGVPAHAGGAEGRPPATRVSETRGSERSR